MRPLTANNVESELSYAYLHAVAAHAAVACTAGTRSEDNAGIDARLTGWGPFPPGSRRQEVDLKVQLKATVKAPTRVGNTWAYSLAGIGRYDDLRSSALTIPRILVVLFLPSHPDEWVLHTDDALSLRRCAYWVSLRGAPPSSNTDAQTVYLPTSQRFDREGLSRLMADIASDRIPEYSHHEATS